MQQYELEDWNAYKRVPVPSNRKVQTAILPDRIPGHVTGQRLAPPSVITNMRR